MPGDAVGTRGEEVFCRSISSTTVYKMDFWVSFWCARCGVDVEAAEIPAPVKGFMYRELGEILIAKDDDLLLSNEKGELVFAFVVELAQLDACHFGTD